MRTEPQTDCEIWVITVNHEASLQYMCRWMGNAGQGKIIDARGGRSTLHIFYEHGVLLEISPLKTKDMLSHKPIFYKIPDFLPDFVIRTKAPSIL